MDEELSKQWWEQWGKWMVHLTADVQTILIRTFRRNKTLITKRFVTVRDKKYKFQWIWLAFRLNEVSSCNFSPEEWQQVSIKNYLIIIIYNKMMILK